MQKSYTIKWVKHSTSSKVIKITRDIWYFVICQRLRCNFIEENWQPGMGFFFDNFTDEAGRQSTQRCIPFFHEITDQWNGIQIKSDWWWRKHFLHMQNNFWDLITIFDNANIFIDARKMKSNKSFSYLILKDQTYLHTWLLERNF